ncbi:hypothetical protein [Actinomadura sp. WMMA1423]|uniref:hypothetical protein n=1 Tax=Actinomadura sp. WMMA1423 TaxID=2591108 RepID=UPI00114786EF|nr:hypothetical protein [Actinomadura sp. WMMA1423]
MTAHLSDSDRQALRLAQDLREEMRAALPQLPAPPSVSPFVDQGGMPSVLLKMDAETARALMAVLAERRSAAAAEQRRADGSHVPPPVPPPAAQAVPAAQGPIVGAMPYGEPAYAETPYAETPYAEAPYAETPYAEAPYGEPRYAESPYIPPQPGPAVFTGGTGPTPLVQSVYPTH